MVLSVVNTIVSDAYIHNTKSRLSEDDIWDRISLNENKGVA